MYVLLEFLAKIIHYEPTIVVHDSTAVLYDHLSAHQDIYCIPLSKIRQPSASLPHIALIKLTFL